MHVLEMVKLSTAIQQPEKGSALHKEGWREKGRMTHWNRVQSKGLHPEVAGFGVCGSEWGCSDFLSHPFSQTEVLLSFHVYKSQICSLYFCPIFCSTKRKKMGKDCKEEVGGLELMRGTLLIITT